MVDFSLLFFYDHGSFEPNLPPSIINGRHSRARAVLAEGMQMSTNRFSLFLIPTLAAVLMLAACTSTQTPKPPPPPPVRPTPTPAPATTTTLSLREYLKGQLGANYHTREEWAGKGPEFSPKTYSWRIWAPIGKVAYLTIHHAEMRPQEDTAQMIRSIFRDHTRLGGRLDAADVGYHFLVDVRGQVWEGRDADHVGTHVGSRPQGLSNPGNLGICALGSYTRQDPPQIIVDQIVNLSVLIAKYYRHPLIVRGHRDWSGINGAPEGYTTCPGRLECAVVAASTKIATVFSATPTTSRTLASVAAKNEERRMKN